MLTYVLRLKQFRHREEEVSGFRSSELVALHQQVEQLGEQMAAFSRLQRSFVEDTLVLDHNAFLQALEGQVII
jgi:hypothetical protein